MTVAVAQSATNVRVFCTHWLESDVTPGWSLFCHYLLACCYNFFLCDMSLEAACFSFVELTLLNRVAFVTSDFCVFVFLSLVQTFFRMAYGEKPGLSRILIYSPLAPGCRRLFSQRELLRRLTRTTERSGDGRNLH